MPIARSHLNPDQIAALERHDVAAVAREAGLSQTCVFRARCRMPVTPSTLRLLVAALDRLANPQPAAEPPHAA